MNVVLDTLIGFISLAFLMILGIIAGVAIPGLFLGVIAPWLDRLLPFRDDRRP
jgi:hypothetical protein